MEISTGSNSIVLIILSVYLPYQCPENEVKYLEKLGFINALTNELDTTCFVINGDWNANLREGGNSLFAKHMVQLCDDNGFTLSSKVLLPADSFTQFSEAWGSVSWLDYIVSSSDFHNCINTVSIDHDLSDADHIPVRMDISLDDIPGTSSCDEGSYRILCWDKLNADGRAKYRDVSHELLCQVIVPNAVYCTNVNCTDPYHITDTVLHVPLSGCRSAF